MEFTTLPKVQAGRFLGCSLYEESCPTRLLGRKKIPATRATSASDVGLRFWVCKRCAAVRQEEQTRHLSFSFSPPEPTKLAISDALKMTDRAKSQNGERRTQKKISTIKSPSVRVSIIKKGFRFVFLFSSKQTCSILRPNAARGYIIIDSVNRKIL